MSDEAAELSELKADQTHIGELLSKVSPDGHDVIDNPPAPEQVPSGEPLPKEGDEPQPGPEPPQSDSAQDEIPTGDGEPTPPEGEQPPTAEDIAPEDQPLDDFERDKIDEIRAPKGAS